MTRGEAERICEEFAAKLGEHFDHVQIMATWTEEGGTMGTYRGAGNWYARQGMAHEFINQDIAQDTAAAIARRINPPDDGEDWKQAVM